jgi:hypothetical protein
MHIFKYPNPTREVSTIMPKFVEIGATMKMYIKKRNELILSYRHNRFPNIFRHVR